MQIAYLLYDRFTALDIIGPHDVLNSVPGNESIFVAEEPGPVRNESDTLSLVADASIDEVAKAVQLGIEYDPEPPRDAGSPEKAPQPIVELGSAGFASKGDPVAGR